MRTHLLSFVLGGLGLEPGPGARAVAVSAVARVVAPATGSVELDGALRDPQATTPPLVDGLQVEAGSLQACPAAVRCLEFELGILLLLVLVEVLCVLEGREELLLPLLALGVKREAVAGEPSQRKLPVGLCHRHSLVSLRYPEPGWLTEYKEYNTIFVIECQ